MATSPDPRREHPSTYVVLDRANKEELTRLHTQDRLFTAEMGGVLAEQPDPTIFRRVLDVGCGTGGWLIDLARTYPDTELLIGVDINNRMVQFAREQAEEQQLGNRVEFHVMDALRMLEFPSNYFDLVNVRSAMSYLRTWDWLKFLQECRRVSRPGTIVRITDGDMLVRSTSPALTRLMDFIREAFYQAGYLFTPEGDSVIRELPKLFNRFGFQNIQVCEHRIVARPGMENWQLAYEDTRLMFRTVLPFLQKWLRLPENYQEIYKQMLEEIERPDFESTTILHTVWGNTPSMV